MFYNNPLFIQANVDHIREAWAQVNDPESAHLVFTAHSIPESMAANCDYAMQLEQTAILIAEALNIKNWELVYQSRSGSPSQPWLGPDICDHVKTLREAGVKEVVVAPIGFVSDHMEVVYDLDVEARRVAEEIGMNLMRAMTAGTHPAFVRMIRELMLERINDVVPKNICPPDCCRIT